MNTTISTFGFLSLLPWEALLPRPCQESGRRVLALCQARKPETLLNSCCQEVHGVRGALKKGQILQEGMLERLDLVNRPLVRGDFQWRQKAKRGKGTHLLRAYVPVVVCMFHLTCTATPMQYNALFEREKQRNKQNQKLRGVKWSSLYQIANRWRSPGRS